VKDLKNGTQSSVSTSQLADFVANALRSPSE
jgi:hypothetical protein